MKLLVIITCVISTLGMLMGCTSVDPNAEGNFENISLESSVVELANASLIIHEDKDYTEDLEPIMVIQKVDVEYLFKNIAGRIINVTVNVEFYDIDNNLLYVGGPKIIHNLLKDYTERTKTEANIISYSGSNVADVDHVKIVVVENQM